MLASLFSPPVNIHASAEQAQKFRRFTSHLCPYSILYPIGWKVKSVSGRAGDTFADPHQPLRGTGVTCFNTHKTTLKRAANDFHQQFKQVGFKVSDISYQNGRAVFTGTNPKLVIKHRVYKTSIEVVLTLHKRKLFLVSLQDLTYGWRRDAKLFGRILGSLRLR